MADKRDLAAIGWGPFFQRSLEPFLKEGLEPARVVREERRAYLVCCASGEMTGQVSGRFAHAAADRGDFPAVGDWVALAARPREGAATIHAVLDRKSLFSRNVAGGRTDEQVLAADVDIVFLVSALDGDFKPRRIARYLSRAWSSGASPVIILNKTDLCAEVEAKTAAVESIAPAVPVHALSATESVGLGALDAYLGAGQTIVLLGSSGVGKSTLINRLLGQERLPVRAVSQYDGRGMHTTTRRELVVLPHGGVLIDTPGLRELQMWAHAGEGPGSFEDMEELAGLCRFADCRHEGEPGCAVARAIEDGAIEAARLQSYRKLEKELLRSARRQAYKKRLADKGAMRSRREKLARKEKRRDDTGGLTPREQWQ